MLFAPIPVVCSVTQLHHTTWAQHSIHFCSPILKTCKIPSDTVFISCYGNLPRSGWLKTTEMYSIIIWRPQVWSQGVHRAIYPPQAWGTVLSLLFPSSGALGIPCLPWLIATSLQSLPLSSCHLGFSEDVCDCV